MLRFASPWFFALLPVAVAGTWWMSRRRRSADARLGLPGASELSLLAASPWLRVERFLPWLRGAAMGLTIVALARPQSGSRIETVSTLGVDIIVALDVSGSMRAEDFRPLNRLEVARRTVRRFIEGRATDRIGLVVFAGLATTRCPLTLDHEMLTQFLAVVDFAPEGEDGTAVGMGLATAVNRLRSSTAKSKVVVLVTDGKNNRGQLSPEAAAEAARALGIRVYTVGVGTEGEAPYPVDAGPFGKRYRMIPADLDEPLLRQIAETSHGRYFRANDADGLRNVFDMIDGLEKTEIESRVRMLYTERFAFALLPAAMLLSLEGLLALTRLKRIP